jgi:hypothetical protein
MVTSLSHIVPPTDAIPRLLSTFSGLIKSQRKNNSGGGGVPGAREQKELGEGTNQKSRGRNEGNTEGHNLGGRTAQEDEDEKEYHRGNGEVGGWGRTNGGPVGTEKQKVRPDRRIPAVAPELASSTATEHSRRPHRTQTDKREIEQRETRRN